MHPSVHGVFVDKEPKSDNPEDLFCHMLDSWYNSELCQPGVNSQTRFLDILKDPHIDLCYLIHRMEFNQVRPESERIHCWKEEENLTVSSKF